MAGNIADGIRVHHNPAEDLSDDGPTGDELVEGPMMTAGEVNERIRGRIDIEAYTKLLKEASERALYPPLVYDGRGGFDREASDKLADQAADNYKEIHERMYGRNVEDDDDPMPVNYVETDHKIKEFMGDTHGVDYSKAEQLKRTWDQQHPEIREHYADLVEAMYPKLVAKPTHYAGINGDRAVVYDPDTDAPVEFMRYSSEGQKNQVVEYLAAVARNVEQVMGMPAGMITLTPNVGKVEDDGQD